MITRVLVVTRDAVRRALQDCLAVAWPAVDIRTALSLEEAPTSFAAGRTICSWTWAVHTTEEMPRFGR